MKEQTRPIAAVILAAGLGTRMKSERVKVLHEFFGRPFIDYPVELAIGLNIKPLAVVVGYQKEAVIQHLTDRFQWDFVFCPQEKQLGTAHAVLQAREALKDFEGDVLILYGDAPLLTPETISRLIQTHQANQAILSLITTSMKDPTGYGRIIRDPQGQALKIIEEKDLQNDMQRQIREINAGMYLVDRAFLFGILDQIGAFNQQREFYLTDILEIAVNQGKNISLFAVPDEHEIMGINDRTQLSLAGKILQERINNQLMRNGVTLLQWETDYIDATVEIGTDTIIHPFCQILGQTHIGKRCLIQAGSIISNSTLGDDTVIKPYSIITDSVVGKKVNIGPFSHLRPHNEVGDNCKIGNFVECKKVRIGEGTKANHLTYLGDAVIGKNVNIGAGTITCNYDGEKKHVTTIGDNVFVGSDSQFVAPVTVHSWAYIGSGSTITQDVPSEALGIARTRQRNIEGYTKRKKPK